MWVFNRVIRSDIQLKKLEDWIKKRGFTLIKGKQKHIVDEVCMKQKIIKLSTRQNQKNQIYSLLHECGHVLTRTNKKIFLREFPILASQEENDRKKPLRFYAEEVAEEYLAWKNGEKLAKQLQIPLNTDDYYQYASRFLLRYMALATVDRKWLIK